MAIAGDPNQQEYPKDVEFAVRWIALVPGNIVSAGDTIVLIGKVKDCASVSVVVTSIKTLTPQQLCVNGTLIVAIPTVPCDPAKMYSVTVEVSAPGQWPVTQTFTVT